MAIEAAIVAECELVEIGIEVLVAATTCQRPRPTSPAARADKPFRPPLRRKVGRTAFFVRKFLLKPAHRASAAPSAILSIDPPPPTCSPSAQALTPPPFPPPLLDATRPTP